MFTESVLTTRWNPFLAGFEISGDDGSPRGWCRRRRDLDAEHGGRCYEVADAEAKPLQFVTFHGRLLDLGAERFKPFIITSVEGALLGSVTRHGIGCELESDGEVVGHLKPPKRWFSSGRRFLVVDTAGREVGSITHGTAGLATFVGASRQRFELGDGTSARLRILRVAMLLAVKLALQPRGSSGGG